MSTKANKIKRSGKQKKKVDHTVIRLHMEEPEDSYIEDLAHQLLRIVDGDPTSLVYPYSTELPQTFDPANPPPQLEPNSKLAMLVHRFYSRRTRRACTVNLIDEQSGRRKRCSFSGCGFQEILNHQTIRHKRLCYYFCLADDCMAGFDKICNAKRHVEAVHSEHAVANRRRAEEVKKHEMGRHLKAAHAKAKLRKVQKGKVKKRSSQGSQVSKRAHFNASSSSGGSNVKSKLHNQPIVLDLSSEVSRDITSGDLQIVVTPRGSTSSDIESFHSESLATGKLKGPVQSSELMEWVAVTGLLQIKYSPSNVHYKFTRQG